MALAQGGINPWLTAVLFVGGLIGVRAIAVGVGVTGSAGDLWSALGGIVAAIVATALVSRRVLLLTDRGVVVLEYGRFGGVKPTRVLARLPLGTGIGSLSGLWARIELGGERLWVHKKWQGAAAAFTGVGAE